MKVYTLLHLLLCYNGIMEFRIKRYCAICGTVHEGKCVREYHSERNSEADKFRNTQLWKRTAKAIMERDFNCCRVCLMNGIFKNRKLSVHHIIPLAEDFERRLDDGNLITLCGFHHEQAERGAISRKLLLELAAREPMFPAL